jgi:hypothetical protein
MCGTKILAIVATVVAVLMAILVSFWHDTAITQIMFVSRFIDVMLPVLAVGALLKYLFHCCGGVCKKD